MLRGVKCNICGALGSHYSSMCTQRVTGVPAGMRSEEPPVVEESTTRIQDSYLNPAELDALIRKRPELPPFLRCRACATLPQDAVWCQCCDIFVCSECLGPPDDCWVCPLCENCSVDNFHIIQAMRSVITAWFESVAQLVDPYAVDSDEEGPCPARPNRKRLCLS